MIEMDAELVLAELNAIVARAASAGLVLELIGQSEVDNARGRIQQTKVNPWGGDWAPWADSTAYSRERKGTAGQGLLWDRGDLLDSIHFAITGESVEIGSDLDYARYLQEGTESMPARPFLGWAEHALPFYEQLWINYLQTGVP